MKKEFTSGEKLLLAAPLLFLVIAGALWLRQKAAPSWLDLPTSNSVKNLEFSPDSRRLAMVSVDGGGEGTTGKEAEGEQAVGEVYDLDSRARVCKFEVLPQTSTVGTAGYYNFPSWSPDGNRVAAVVYSRVAGRLSYQAKEIAIWDARTGAVKADHVYSNSLGRATRDFLQFSADGKTITGGGIPPARFDATTGKRLNQPNPKLDQEAWVESNEKLGLVAIRNPQHRQFQVLDSRALKTVWDPGVVKFDKFEWCDEVLSLKETDKQLWLWSGKTRRPLPSPPVEFDFEIGDNQFSPDRKTVAYSICKTIRPDSNLQSVEALKGAIVAWDYRANRVLWRTEIALKSFSLNWSPDGKRLAVLAADTLGENRLLIFGQDGQLQSERGPVGYIARWSPDSKTLVTLLEEIDNTSGKILSNRLEMHRFDE